MAKLSAWKSAFIVFALCAATAIAAPAQTFTTLASFNDADGRQPTGSLVQGTDGNFYGTTYIGGDSDGCQAACGVVFRITPAGTLTALHSFCSLVSCADGSQPTAGLVLATDGNFYGTTTSGGGGQYCNGTGCGTVFRMTPAGTLTTLYSFCSLVNCADGAGPQGALVQASDGSLYGTTPYGGAGAGTVFKITLSGTLTTLHSFEANERGGFVAGLAQGTDGNFYGTTQAGGVNNEGTVFKITPAGAFTTLYNFCAQPSCTDGFYPFSALVQATDGSFYGTTLYGGSTGSFCYPTGCGTIFKITPEGKLTTLYIFCNQTACPNGALPQAALVQGSDGNLYGTTGSTIFNITQGGALTTLYRFDDQASTSGLVQTTNGKFYGTTGGDGTDSCGTVFSLSMNLGPFVSFVRNPAKVGQTFGVLGQGFTGTTSVSLNGTPISFTVFSDTFLEATIPNGATTGFVTGTSPRGTLTSNVPFRVLPQLLSFSPPSGPIGTVVTITGVSLTQTVGIGFGDQTPASFTVNSDTQVTATVPAGAQTGPVGVETLGGISISSGKFTVTP
jgi:uncharacterized repeat protein (TIGR03803 family)